MSQNIPNPTSNLSTPQNQMSMQGRMPQPMPQQAPNWPSSYYAQPSQSPYSMNPYMPHGSAGAVPGHATSIVQPSLPPAMGQKSPASVGDRTRAAYPHTNLYGQPPTAGSASGTYYGYDPYYNQMSSDPYLTHSGSTSHWSSTGNSMLGSGSSAPGAPMQTPLRPKSGLGNSSMVPPTQSNTSQSLPPLASRPPPPSAQTPDRGSATQHQTPDHLMSPYDRQRASNISQQPSQPHPSSLMTQNMSSSSSSNLSPTQTQMSMQSRMQSQAPLGSMSQQPSWSSSYYGQPNQSPYSMNPYMSHGGSSAVPNQTSSLSQPPSVGPKQPTNGNDRTRASYPPPPNLYGQAPVSGSTPSAYYGYDQSYNQVSSDPYSTHSSAGVPHWSPAGPTGSSMMNSGSTSMGGPLQPSLRPQTGSSLPSQPSSSSLQAMASRPPPPPSQSQTPDRSPAPQISGSYPSPGQQNSSTKSGSNSLAQLEQMVMPGSSQPANNTLKSPTHRSTTSSPSTNAPMQYSYNSSGQGSYFSPSANSNQPSSYYPYDSASTGVDVSKPGWPDQSSSSMMNPPPPGSSMDPGSGSYGQTGYDGSSGYGDYTQLSTPSQSRFPASSDMTSGQHQIDKSDPYAIDSQTFEDHEDQAPASKTKKSRAKKGDETAKKEKRQRAPRAPKGAAAAASTVAAQTTTIPPQSPTSLPSKLGQAISSDVPTLTNDGMTPTPQRGEVVQPPPNLTQESSDADVSSNGPPRSSVSMPLLQTQTANPPEIVEPLAPQPMTPSQPSSAPVKSPVHHSPASSPAPIPPQPIQYDFNASTNSYNGNSLPSHTSSYYSQSAYGTSAEPKPSWSDQPLTMMSPPAAVPSSSDLSPNQASQPTYDQPSTCPGYTQLSSTAENQTPEDAGVQQDAGSLEPRQSTTIETPLVDFSSNEQDEKPTKKAKKSKSKKGDDGSKKEKRQRTPKAPKNVTQSLQLDDIAPGESTLLAAAISETSVTMDGGESRVDMTPKTEDTPSQDLNENLDQTPKPKRSRSKKSDDKPKRERKSRAAPKPPLQSDQLATSPILEPTAHPDSIADESAVSETLVTVKGEPASAEKPKRIRIRDSSSKSKKKLPKFALKFAKTKKRKRLGSSDNEQSDLDKTPPPSPDEVESGVQKRRSARNTKKLKYNDDIELGFSDSDDESQATPARKRDSSSGKADGDESVVSEEPTVFAAPVEDTMVVEKIMASRVGKRELEPEPGETLPPDGTYIDVEEFYVKYKNMSYLHCDWRTLEELEKGDRRVSQKIKRYKQKKDSSNLFSFMEEEPFDPQYCEVDRILAVNEVEELFPESDEEEENKPDECPIVEPKIENVDVPSTGIEESGTNPEACTSNTPCNEASVNTDPKSANKSDDTSDQAGSVSDNSAVIDEKKENSASADAIVEETGTEVKSDDIKPSENTTEQKSKKMKKKVSRHYLVKWRGLSYEDSTWELEEHLDPEKIRQFERFKDPPPKQKWKPVKRPKPEEWVRKETSPIYKNNNTLREYQLEGINWLSFCWHQGRNCILADEMGLGKTIQSIAFINEIYEHGINGPFLIIVPLSTVGNWAREFETWTDLNVITYHGSSTSREMLKEYEMFYRNEQGNRITSVYKFQVMITTFEIILSDCLDLREIPWRCCIIDEAHRLKNRNCKLLEGLRLLNMEHRVLLTGTPLQNNVEELFSLLNFLEPTQFASTEQFLQEFGDLKTEAQVDKLKLILKPMMLRRLKEDVEKTLAPKEETIVEVELTNIQKKYYRAILEKNFSFLAKGGTNNNMPNLMNTMMELRKCCIHPYLINGAEEQILYEAKQAKSAGGEPMSSHQAMINASGKLVLIDKLLPRLKADGHRVLIFSQMVRCLDILEDYVTHKHYPYERIDGRVRGSDRQQAIDRYSKPGSDRFVFLLCTRAGGLGINLTAADTVIIFDSDWNPQNDLQAQARCHRIGQSKAVKIYRLICRNTYEREMFDKASLKLGLDKAVLQSMNTQKAAGSIDGQLTKKEIEELLRKGAYGALMDDDNAGDKFCEEDIDQILQRRTQVITIESVEAKGSTFSKATFSSSNNREDIELDDPNFWEKWAKKANIDTDDLTKDELIQLAPRRRTQTKRYGADGSVLEMSDFESSDEDEETISMRTRGSRRGQPKLVPGSASKRNKRRGFEDGDDDFMTNIDGGYWSKSDCLKIENGLLTYGWGRWENIIANNRFKREITTEDCENISRVILLYCLNSYKGDEKIKSFSWDLISPPEEIPRLDDDEAPTVSTRGRKPKSAPPAIRKPISEEISDADWPKEAKNDPLIALPDDQYRRHLQRNCNRLLIRVKLLHYLKNEILKGYTDQILANCNASEVDLPSVPVDGELPAPWWDDEVDRSLLIGIFKHGHDKFTLMRQDVNLCFLQRCGPPNNEELMAELNNKNMDYYDDDNKVSINLKRTEAGLCLHDLLNSVVQDLAETGDSKNDSNSEVVDENKNSILKCSETNDSIDLCENGIADSSQTNKLDVTDEDSLMNESSIDPTLPDTIYNEAACEMEPGEFFPFPSVNDLNQRFRRLITAYQRNSKRLEIKLAQKARDELKKERTSKFEAARNEREERKRSQAQKWSRREEGDFAKVISFFGVEYNPKAKRHDWTKFKAIGKLEKKLDDTLEEYYKAFVIMCKRATSQTLTSDEEKCPIHVEPITEDRASKCLARIEFFSKIREKVLCHPQLDKRLRLCQSQSDLPDWWINGKHDKDLLTAASKHGLYRLDYNLAHDSSLSIYNIIKGKVEELFKNPPSSILIPLDQLQELLDRNGVEYSKDIELDNNDEDVKTVISILLDSIEAEDMLSSRSKTTRSGSTSMSTRITSNSNSRRGANTLVKSIESTDSSRSLRLTSYGDGRCVDRRVAEVTPVLPDKIPNELQKTHEAGELTITIVSESVLLKLDDKPPMVLLGASNPISVKIRWPKDKAIQTRLENLIHCVEKNEWPVAKPSVPTISLPNHLSGTPNTLANSSASPSKSEKDIAPASPTSDTSNLSSKAPRDYKEPSTDAPLTRGRRSKGRRPRQPDTDAPTPPHSVVEPELPREDRHATAKLRNLLSQGTSSGGASRHSSSSQDKLSARFANLDKQGGAGLSSLLASGKQKKGDTAGPSRVRDDKGNPPLPESALANAANLLPQILANLKPEFRDSSFAALLSNPDTASLLINSITAAGNLNSPMPPRSTVSSVSHASSMPLDTSFSTPTRSSKSHKSSEKSSSKYSAEKQSSGASSLPSLLASFNNQQKSNTSLRSREDRNIVDNSAPAASAPSQPAANAMNLLPQILANMKPEFRDLLANQDAASIFSMINSLGNIPGMPNLNFNPRPNVSSAQMQPMDNLIGPARSTTSSAKGPPPAHQRSDNAPAAHGSSTRELRHNSHSNRDNSPPSVRSTRGKTSISNLDALEQPQKQTDGALSRSSFGKKRGRPSSSANDSPPGPAPGADVLDLSSLPPTRKSNSLLRSESRSRRHREQAEETPSVSTRSASNLPPRSSGVKTNTRSEQEPEVSESEQADISDKGGRTTRASKRIGSRIDALALNLQAKRLHRSDSPELSPSLSKEKASQDNQTTAHEQSSSNDQKTRSGKAPPAAHSSSHKSGPGNSSVEKQSHRHREKPPKPPALTSVPNLGAQTSTVSTSRPAIQDPIAQLMSKLAPQPNTSTSGSNLQNQANSSQAPKDPLAQLMSNPANLLAGLNPSALSGAGDIMNQLLRKAGTNDIVKNLVNEFVKNPNLALDPNILTALTASLPMGTQSMPSFNLPTSAATSLPYGNYSNPLANPFLPFGMANLGMNNPLGNPLGMFPNLYMPQRFPGADHQPQQPQQPAQQQRQPSSQGGGTSDSSSRDKKMRYPRK